MASGQANKKTTTKRTTQSKSRSTGTRRKQTPKKTQQEVFSDGIMLAVVVAISIFLICCNMGLCGVLGSFVSRLMFGLFGLVQFVLPILISAAFILAVVYNYSAYILRKITFSGVFMLFICALCHMSVHISWGFKDNGIIQSYIYSSEHKSAGGAIGAIVTGIFYPLLAKGGTWVFVILVLVILFFIIAGTSVIDLVKQIYSWYHMDEDEIVAREEFLAKKQQRMQEQQKERRTVRKQRYQEATAREEEQLSRLERRRQRFDKDKLLLNLAEGDNDSEGVKGQGLLPSDKDGSKILSNQGLISSTDGNVSDNGKKATGTAKEDKTPIQKKKHIVEMEPDGELHIRGLVEPLEEESSATPQEMTAVHNTDKLEKRALAKGRTRKKDKLESAIRQADTLPVSSFDNTMNTTVNETTAEFVKEDDWVDETLDTIKPDETADTAVKTGEKESVGGSTASRCRTKQSAQEAVTEAQHTAQAIGEAQAESDYSAYEKPMLELLERGKRAAQNTKAELQATAKKLEQTLASFGVHVTVTDVSCGPAVTRYEMLPEQGTRVNKITSLADDIKLNLAVADIRIEAPIPGKAAIGIEVPNKEASMVCFRDLLEGSSFFQEKSDLSFAVGKDISGEVVVTDIAKMPHVLIAGATGSGKSVCINTLIMSLLYKAHPDEVKLIMIDPKVVELSVYNEIPHLLIPVVTDPKKASGALNWAVAEMDARYKKFAEYNVRNLEGYNKKVDQLTKKGDNAEGEIKRMPKIVIIVDELADLMMVAHGEVEDAIVRLSQLARAAGIHLVIATQRPSVDVITGLIKANVPSRIAFAVSSGVDSRTILDMVGAEKLLGKGDMLFAPSGIPKPIRVQGAFISDKEVGRVVEFLKAQKLSVQYNDNITKEINCGPRSVRDANKEQDRDEYFVDAAKFIIEKEKASIGMLQRVYKIGFNRAARIMDQLSEAGVVGPEEGTKPRQILMSMEEFENFLEQGN